MSPWSSMAMATGFLSMFSSPALVEGRSIGTPDDSSGAATMKMMSSTSMTSMKGVMLMSAMAR